MVLRLVVHPHVVCDVSGGQELPTDVTGHLLLVANHVRTQPILRGKAGLTGLTEGTRRQRKIRENYTKCCVSQLTSSSSLKSLKTDNSDNYV